jgi:hypothetical protein
MLPNGHYDAGGQAFQIPLPGTWKHLIAVVDFENQVALWRGEEAEVAQMLISADLHLDVGDGRLRQVACHNHRRTA